MNLTFGRKLTIGFGLPLVLLVVIGWVAFRATTQLIASSEAVKQEQAIVEGLGDLLSQLKDTETGMRGFVATGKDEFKEPFTLAEPRARADLDRLTAALDGREGELAKLDAVRELVQKKVDHERACMEVRSRDGLQAGVAMVALGLGKTYMDALRVKIASISEDERRILSETDANSHGTANSARLAVAVGSLAAVVLVGLAAWILTRQLTGQVLSAAQQLQSSSTELEASSSQQAAAVKEQVAATTEVGTTIKELLLTSRQIAESAQRVVKIAEETGDGAVRGDGNVKRATEGMAAIKKQVDLIVSHMLELGRKSQQIGGILDLINELSEQTNILSINATIESAGAGESGRRFAVIADEIRRLADRVRGATKEVRGLIDEIRASANTATMVTEDGAKAVDAGGRQFSDVAANFSEIAERVWATTEAAREIELSTKQQATAVEQVTVAITNVTQAARETESSAAETLKTSSQLTSLARWLLRLVEPSV